MSEVQPVKVVSFGRHMIGRDIGRAIRQRYFEGPPTAWPATLDFKGVEQATESCIDELFGELARDFGLGAVAQIRIEGASRAVRETIDYVIALVAEPPAPLDPEAIRGLLAERGGGPTRRKKAQHKK